MLPRLSGEKEVMFVAEKNWAAEAFLAGETQRAALELLEQAQAKSWNAEDARGVSVLVGLLAKAIKTSRATVLLAEHGLTVDAEGLYRTLLLTLAVVRWICHHPDEAQARAHLYVDICLAQDLRFRNAAKSSPALRGLLASQLGEHLERQRAALIDRHGEEGVEGLAEQCPWRSDAFLAMQTSLSVPYDIFYRRASRILHAQDITEHVNPFPDSGDVSVLPFPTELWGPELFLLTSHTLVVILSELNRSLECEMEGTLDLLRQRAEEIRVKREKQGGA